MQLSVELSEFEFVVKNAVCGEVEKVPQWDAGCAPAEGGACRGSNEAPR